MFIREKRALFFLSWELECGHAHCTILCFYRGFNRGYPLVSVSEVPRLTFWEVGVIVEHWVVYSIQ